MAGLGIRWRRVLVWGVFGVCSGRRSRAFVRCRVGTSRWILRSDYACDASVELGDQVGGHAKRQKEVVLLLRGHQTFVLPKESTGTGNISPILTRVSEAFHTRFSASTAAATTTIHVSCP